MTKTWLITGASRGLGRHLARHVLDRGHRVVATARRPEDLDAGYGSQIRTAALESPTPGPRAAVEQFDSLDVVANNAGYANSSTIEDTPDDDFRAQVETNFFGVVNVTKADLPVLRRQRSGHILKFSSIGGRVGGTPGLAAYQSAKFAVAGFSEVLHNEVKPFGIQVTMIEPGAFRTDWGGSSMRIPPVSPGYEQTVGQLNAYRRSIDGKQPGDPARAATIIADIVDLNQPPLRLLLGPDAIRHAEQASAAHAAEAAAWADVSRSTDFDATIDIDTTPIAKLLDHHGS